MCYLRSQRSEKEEVREAANLTVNQWRKRKLTLSRRWHDTYDSYDSCECDQVRDPTMGARQMSLRQEEWAYRWGCKAKEAIQARQSTQRGKEPERVASAAISLIGGGRRRINEQRSYTTLCERQGRRRKKTDNGIGKWNAWGQLNCARTECISDSLCILLCYLSIFSPFPFLASRFPL